MTPRPVQHGGGVKGPGAEQPLVLRVRADCRGRLFTAKLPARPNAVHEMLSRPLRLLAETRHHNSGFRASAVRSVAGGSSDPDGRWRRPDASTTHTGSTVPRFYSSDDPPWCRVRATHRETVIPSDLLFASQRQACAEKPPPITNLYDCTARKRQCHQPP